MLRIPLDEAVVEGAVDSGVDTLAVVVTSELRGGAGGAEDGKSDERNALRSVLDAEDAVVVDDDDEDTGGAGGSLGSARIELLIKSVTARLICLGK